MVWAAAAGALSTLAHVHTEAWWLGPLAAGLLAHIVWRTSVATAAWAAWAFGTAWMVAGTWWLFISMHRYGGLPAPLAALAVFALGAALSLYWALAMGLAARWRTGRARWDVPAFAAAWLLAELARGQWFTGFPWAASGYAQVDSPLAAWAPWVGVYGMGAWVALIGGALAWVGHRARLRSRGGLVAPALILLAAGVPGRWGLASSDAPGGDFTRSTGTLTVSLVQTAIPQDEKFDPGRLERLLDDLATALRQARGALVVVPETAVPLLPQDLPAGLWADLAAPFAGSGGLRAALVGVPLTTAAGGYSNSVVAWGEPSSAAQGPGATSPARGAEAAAQSLEPALPPLDYRYDKHHLVPFGEFIPLGFRWFVNLMHIPLGDFDRGAVVQASYPFAGQRLAPNICYEDLFGEELAQRFHDSRGAPTMLVNLSNIAWFGPTLAIDQHLHISRLRSLELQRPMLRATNTGATAVIDHRGQVRAWFEPQARGVLEAQAEGREGLTPYAAWAGRLGLWPLWLLGLAFLAAAGAISLRRASRMS